MLVFVLKDLYGVRSDREPEVGPLFQPHPPLLLGLLRPQSDPPPSVQLTHSSLAYICPVGSSPIGLSLVIPPTTCGPSALSSHADIVGVGAAACVLGALLGAEHALQPGGKRARAREAVHVVVEVSHRVPLAHEIAWAVIAVQLPEPANSDSLAPAPHVPRHTGAALL